MRKKMFWKRLIVLATVCACTFSYQIPVKEARAENPIIQTHFTADPSPLVVGDTIYVYTEATEKASHFRNAGL